MQPWRVAVGLGAAIGGVALLVLLSRFEYLAPHAGFIAQEYWWPLLLYAGAAIFTVMTLIAVVTRRLALVDVGRKVDLVERSIRRGEGDVDLSRHLHDEERGHFPD